MIALAMEAGYDDDAVLFHEKEDSIGEAPNTRSPSSFLDHRKLQRVPRDAIECVLDSGRKTLS
jgi:hypothetical protein